MSTQPLGWFGRPSVQPSTAARRFGYLLGTVISFTLLGFILVEPGWRNMSFLTRDASDVIGLVTLSIVVGIAVNMLYIVADPPPVKRAGDLVTSVLACAVCLRVLQVFPFDFDPTWTTIARSVLIFAAAGAGIAAMVNLIYLIVRPWRQRSEGTPR